MRIERVVLENHGKISVLGVRTKDRNVIRQHIALIGRFQSGDNA